MEGLYQAKESAQRPIRQQRAALETVQMSAKTIGVPACDLPTRGSPPGTGTLPFGANVLGECSQTLLSRQEAGKSGKNRYEPRFRWH
jgi:hypothetical protein